MKHIFRFLGLGAGFAVFAAFSACSSGSGTPIVNGDAGNAETGGAAGNATGGSTSAGGSTASPPKVIDSFDNLTEMQLFTPSNYVPTDCSVNLVVPADSGSSVQFDWSSAVDINADSTTPGSMKVTAVFTNWDQKWEVDMSGPSDAQGNPIDLTNKLVTAEIRITQGVSPNASYPFGAQIFVKTGSGYVWGASTWTNIMAANTWVRLVLDTNSPDGVPAGLTWDPKQPSQLGITLNTGGAGESPYCAKNYGAPFGAPQTTIAYIDQIQIEPRP